MAIKRRKKAIKVKKKSAIKQKSLVKKRRATKTKRVKKARVNKPAKKIITTKRPKRGNVIGIITHYFPKVRAAVVKLKTTLSVGETIKIKGHTTDFMQSVVSMQLDHVPINSAKPGQEIGLMVNSRVRQHDTVYKP